MFPEVKKITKKYDTTDRSERYRYQAPIVMRYLENKLSGWSIADFLEETGAKKVALYAVTEFTEYALKDLAQVSQKEKVLCIGDRGYRRYAQGLCGVPVVAPEAVVTAYQKKEIDKILICSLSHANVIFEDFVKRGVSPVDIFTVTSAIFSF